MDQPTDNPHRQEDLEQLARLRPIDDTFMRALFRGQLPLAQEVLRTITGIGDLVLLGEETQRDLSRLAGARSVELDVWGRDSAGRVYDLEVQRASRGAQPRRARYHSAAMDVDELGRGEGFAELPESYVIFVTEKDFFGDGAGVHRFERADADTGRAFGDGTHILYANASYEGDDELGALMHDFLCSDPDEMYTESLAERARYFKSDPEGVESMCQVMDEIRERGIEIGREEGLTQGREEGLTQGRAEGLTQGREEGLTQGRAEGLTQGRAEGLLDSIASLMDTLKLSAQDAMDALRVPEDERPRYLSQLPQA